MGYFKTTAIIFDSSPTGEHDKYLEMITADGRRVSAKIRKARHTKSKWGASTEPVAVVDIQLYEKQSRLTVTSISTSETFDQIKESYDKSVASAYIAELIGGTTPFDVPEGDTFEITVDTYRALAKSTDIMLTINTFLATIIQASGYVIEMDRCCVCGAEIVGNRRFSVDEVSSVCPDCHAIGLLRIPEFACDAISRLCRGEEVGTGQMDGKLARGVNIFFEKIIAEKFHFKPRSSLHLRGL